MSLGARPMARDLMQVGSGRNSLDGLAAPGGAGLQPLGSMAKGRRHSSPLSMRRNEPESRSGSSVQRKPVTRILVGKCFTQPTHVAAFAHSKIWHRAENLGVATTSTAIRRPRDLPAASPACLFLTHFHRCCCRPAARCGTRQESGGWRGRISGCKDRMPLAQIV
jgi:hypothetical protein